MWSVITLIVILLIGVIAYTIYGHRHHLTPSKGKKINLSERPNSALLIVDLQEDFTNATGKNAYAPDMVEKLIAAINDLVQTANANGSPVISIRQTFRGWYMNFLMKLLNKGRGNPKSKGLDLDARVNGDIDHDIVKSRADGFSEPELDRVLDRQKVGKLIIVGLDGDYCVKATMQAALNRGYEVSFSDATTLALKPNSWKKTKSKLTAGGASDGLGVSTPTADNDENSDRADERERERETENRSRDTA
ncbi:MULTISPECIES: cysteine hydrolase [unclassified Thalassospira]|uniref:cysteine hydrolase family protein n=1 Tax=unclassified Thalassospira TaxID=2648997 RepID=UPI0009E480FD|nr:MULTISPECIES: cysteine hydrolase [unclassified Thalassospira]MBC08156.1 cysteine hydrolase [Thalassospira sp.]|tara:strand:+ start:1234 stop:1980 length:747 start_codon:yes stop_codon:yes gene_type:complete